MQWIVCCLGLLCFSQGHATSAVPPMEFTSSWDTRWQNEFSKQVCRLSRRIGELGEVRFVASAAEPMMFELQLNRDVFASSNIAVMSYLPEWSPHYADSLASLTPGKQTMATDGQPPTEPGARLLGELVHIEGGGAVVYGDVARRMLWAMREGHHLRLQAGSGFSPRRVARRQDIAVEIEVLGFAPALRRFLTCAETQVQIAWQDISRTRISYAVDDYALDHDALQKINPLIKYVSQDASITTIYVDGHTDASGGKRKNLSLSKRRAQHVAEYLAKHGLANRNIVVRYHGASYPVGKNKFSRGKALNRRTTIRLERTPAPLVAQK